VTSGRDLDALHDLIHRIVESFKDKTSNSSLLRDGVTTQFELPIKFRSVIHKERGYHHLAQAQYYYKSDVEFLQILLADKVGKFPDDMMFDVNTGGDQLKLFE